VDLVGEASSKYSYEVSAIVNRRGGRPVEAAPFLARLAELSEEVESGFAAV